MPAPLVPTPAQTMLETEAKNIQKYGEATPTPQTGSLTANASLPAGFQQDATGRIFKTTDAVPKPVVTSNDASSEFDANKAALDAKAKATADATAAAQLKKDASALNNQSQTDKTIAFDEKSGTFQVNDPMNQLANDYVAKQKADFEAKAAKKQEEYEGLYQTSLASIDESTASLINSINQSYAKRLDEQRHINDINVARVQAYGLGGGGRFTPLDFNDAISGEEEAASKKITSLEGERNSLIGQAKAAAASGKNALLRDRMADIARIEEQLNQNLSRVFDEGQKQLEVLQNFRKQEELNHKQKLEETAKRFAVLAGGLLDEFEGKSSADQAAFIQKQMAETGLDYPTVLAAMQEASSNATIAKTKAAKEARGELKTVDGNLYSITYDEAGNPISKLVQAKAPKAAGKGTGGGSSGGGTTSSSGIKLTPTDIKKMKARGMDPADKSDIDDYIKEAYGRKGDDTGDAGEGIASYDDYLSAYAEANSVSPDPNSAAHKANYQAYVEEAKASQPASKSTDSQKKLITSTDKKKMIAQGLDPNIPGDVTKYIKAAYDPNL